MRTGCCGKCLSLRQKTRQKAKLNYEKESLDLFFLSNIILVVKSSNMEWAGHLVRMGEKKDTHRVLERKPERKKPLGRPRHRCEDNIKMDRK